MGKIGVLLDIFVVFSVGVARKKEVNEMELMVGERERGVFGIWRFKMCEVRVGKRVVK